MVYNFYLVDSSLASVVVYSSNFEILLFLVIFSKFEEFSGDRHLLIYINFFYHLFFYDMFVASIRLSTFFPSNFGEGTSFFDY